MVGGTPHTSNYRKLGQWGLDTWLESHIAFWLPKVTVEQVLSVMVWLVNATSNLLSYPRSYSIIDKKHILLTKYNITSWDKESSLNEIFHIFKGLSFGERKKNRRHKPKVGFLEDFMYKCSFQFLLMVSRLSPDLKSLLYKPLSREQGN